MSDRTRPKDKSLIGRLPEVAKSMIVLSLGGVFMAEETLRKATKADFQCLGLSAELDFPTPEPTK